MASHNQSKLTRYLLRPLWRVLWRALLIWLIVTLGVTVALRYVDPPFWSWMIWRGITTPEGYPDRYSHQWMDLDAIPLHMQLAVVAAEDQRFPLHGGWISRSGSRQYAMR